MVCFSAGYFCEVLFNYCSSGSWFKARIMRTRSCVTPSCRIKKSYRWALICNPLLRKALIICF
jgi:hypothetical protein